MSEMIYLIFALKSYKKLPAIIITHVYIIVIV